MSYIFNYNFMIQELIGALLACSFFCLFPNSTRGANHLQVINFDHLFAYVFFYNSILYGPIKYEVVDTYITSMIKDLCLPNVC